MGEVQRIAKQLELAFTGPAWHGPSVKEVLSDVTAVQAATRVIPNAHNIWEITLHIAVWDAVARKRLGGDTVEPNPDEDWPTVSDESEGAWRDALNDLEAEHTELIQVVAGLDKSQLAENVPGGDLPIDMLVYGVINHELYHAGQIALLKKALI